MWSNEAQTYRSVRVRRYGLISTNIYTQITGQAHLSDWMFSHRAEWYVVHHASAAEIARARGFMFSGCLSGHLIPENAISIPSNLAQLSTMNWLDFGGQRLRTRSTPVLETFTFTHSLVALFQKQCRPERIDLKHKDMRRGA